MKRLIVSVVSIILSLWLCSFAVRALPDGTVARLGKGRMGGIVFSPDGSRLATLTSVGVYHYNPLTLRQIDLLETDEAIGLILIFWKYLFGIHFSHHDDASSS